MPDTNDFDEFYRDTVHRVARYAFGLTGDLGTAQDLTQEAYIRAWRNWRTVGQFEHAEAWVRVVVTRLSRDWLRRLRIGRRAHLRLGGAEVTPAPSENTVVLVAAMRCLPAAQRRALCMHYLADMSLDEIATETGAAVGTVKSWLARGRAALAAQLNPTADTNKPEASHVD